VQCEGMKKIRLMKGENPGEPHRKIAYFAVFLRIKGNPIVKVFVDKFTPSQASCMELARSYYKTILLSGLCAHRDLNREYRYHNSEDIKIVGATCITPLVEKDNESFLNWMLNLDKRGWIIW
jgi:hypothetical protein